MWWLLQVRPAGRVTGLHIALGDGFKQPVDFRDVHARGDEPAKGWRQRRVGKLAVAGHAYAADGPAALVVREGGGSVGVFGRGGLTLPAFQPLLLFQLLQTALLIAQLLAGGVVGQHLGRGQQTGQAAGECPAGGAVNVERH